MQSLEFSTSDPSSQMVAWFIHQAKAPLRVEEKQLGEHQYFLCLSGFEDGGNFIPVCGRGPTKLQATIRCIGEWLERKAVFEFFRSSEGPVNVHKITMGAAGNFIISESQEKILPLPTEFWTTSGWAVHTNSALAHESAISEALERHLLISSFLNWGWKGFIEIGKTAIDGSKYQSCISRYKTEFHSAGFAIGRNKNNGLSFGHFCEKTEAIAQSPKWAQALYESADKLNCKMPQARITDPIAIDVDWYLQHRVDMKLASSKTKQEQIKFSSCLLHIENLSKKWSLPFPLYSAFAFGGDLMPLFLPRQLTLEGREFVIALAKSLDFEARIPERMPVL